MERSGSGRPKNLRIRNSGTLLSCLSVPLISLSSSSIYLFSFTVSLLSLLSLSESRTFFLFLLSLRASSLLCLPFLLFLVFLSFSFLSFFFVTFYICFLLSMARCGIWELVPSTHSSFILFAHCTAYTRIVQCNQPSHQLPLYLTVCSQFKIIILVLCFCAYFPLLFFSFSLCPFFLIPHRDKY